MIYYATINENGDYTGFYTKEIHGNKIPTPNVELTEQQWVQANTSSKEGKWKWVNGDHTFVLYEKNYLDDIELEVVRKKRNDLLLQSDWTQLPNNPLTPEKQMEWANYRQQLRDVTNSKPYVFPVKPQ